MNGTLGYPAGYTPQGQPVGGGWQGMSIRDILEKVDLFNFASLGDEGNGKKKDKTNEAPMIPDLKVCVNVLCYLFTSRNLKTFKVTCYTTILIIILYFSSSSLSLTSLRLSQPF